MEKKLHSLMIISDKKSFFFLIIIKYTVMREIKD